MTASIFTTVFVLALLISVSVRVWLSLRQAKHVAQHRDRVPDAFNGSISLTDHRKAAAYTLAKGKLGRIELALGTIWLLILTLGGGLQFLSQVAAEWFEPSGLWHGVVLFGLLAAVGFIYDLPATLYGIFKLEARFGFNRMTPRMFVADTLKQLVLAVVIGTPVLWAVLWLMGRMGANWWIWVWAFWLGLNLVTMIVYPIFIAPLFNKFSPLADESVKARVEALLTRCGFRSKGLFVMDGSKRSAHGNAYFTGFGAGKRIVFFDTLLSSLQPSEVEAVLAHELGHFKHHHLWKRIGVMGLAVLGLLWVLGFVTQQDWFYQGLGVQTHSNAMALILFSMALPVLLFPLTPLTSMWSRKHEFEADAYACKQANSRDLVTALVKLYKENASTLTPDPLHSLFYDSHPPASIRIARLQAQ
ncbi:M48 family metallopeptidase [Uliginosibacterium sp. H3]|uniref:M48 family metallopeptidase n=1 Tax=Uliginosibacterium silvisoli TaxID=3114758 RepID=A0ABU6K558_9RHOO|nr:M48 family metallopeptidase [Uliginosibacterium sp. H3]